MAKKTVSQTTAQPAGNIKTVQVPVYLPADLHQRWARYAAKLQLKTGQAIKLSPTLVELFEKHLTILERNIEK